MRLLKQIQSEIYPETNHESIQHNINIVMKSDLIPSKVVGILIATKFINC